MSVLQNLYWIAGLIIALVAIVNLRRSANQASATFLLALSNQWAALEGAGGKISEFGKNIASPILKESGNLQDKHRIEKLRPKFKDAVNKIHKGDTKEDRDLYNVFIQQLTFFETAGLMVRRGYVPFRDIYLLYKGPILDAEDMFADHIRDIQKGAIVATGFCENFLKLAKNTRRCDENILWRINLLWRIYLLESI